MTTEWTPSEELPINMTARAVEMAKERIAEADEDALGLRIGVKGGGCSGYYYVYDLAKKIRDEKDMVLTFDGLDVIVDKRSLKLLYGSLLDWETRLMGYGFKWVNPNATGDCGCGASFHID